ncbi:MAG TPA: thioredoxin family protein [Longimicrobiaceae bacterium]|nr:thioredoxin family protein [Longimicrobiaceae bacterium]
MMDSAPTSPPPAAVATASVHPPPGLDPRLLRQKFAAALEFAPFLAGVTRLPELWPKLYQRAEVPAAWAGRVRVLPAPLRLLVVSEDWCGDSVNVIPVLQRLVEGSQGRLELRVIGRDAHPELMDAHLTGGARSVPVVLVLDEAFRERGWWGPRPAPLQRWVMEEGLALADVERYRAVRTWYVRDRGATLLGEVVPLLERVSAEAARGAGGGAT